MRAQPICVLLKWELHRFFEMGGLKEIVSCFCGVAPLALIAGLLGDPKFVLTIVPLVPLCGVMTALQSFTKERESGILPALLSSPVTPGELVLGKTAGYSLVGLVLYWAMILGLVLGLKAGLMVREAPTTSSLGIGALMIVAVSLVSLLFAIVTATVTVCWHAKNMRDAMFWSLASAGVATVLAVLLMAAARGLGTAGILIAGSTLGALTAGVSLWHAAGLTSEPVLFRWVTRRPRRGRVKRGSSANPQG